MKQHYLFLLAMAVMPVASVTAEEMKSEVSREQREVQVDGQTGEVRQQHDVQRETVKKQTEPGHTSVQTEHQHKGTVATENVHGERDAVQAQDTTKTAVTSHPDGVHVEHKKEHSEKVLSD